MHPSVLAKDSVDRPRRVARKRDRRASCSAATPSLQISQPIPTLQSKMDSSGQSGSPSSHSRMERRNSGSSGSPKSYSKHERRSSGSSGSLKSHSKHERRRSGSSGEPKSHSKHERRSSGSSESPKSHSKIERRSSDSSGSPKSHSKIERRSSGSSGTPMPHSKLERRSSGSGASSNGFSVSYPRMERRLSSSSQPKMERRLSASSKPTMERRLSASSKPTMERRLSASSKPTMERRLSASSKPTMERRLSASSKPTMDRGLSTSSHPRIERRLSGASASLPFGAPPSMMERRNSYGPAPYTSPAGISISCHTRLERRGSCASTASLSDSFSSVSSVKSCSFREEPEIRHVLSVSDMVDDPSDLWFQKEDFKNFREKTRRIISNVDENGRGRNGKKYCTRGLEKYKAAASIKRKSIRRSILLALEDGDSASLEDLSESCRAEARMLGLIDAKEAGSICKRMVPHRRNSVQ